MARLLADMLASLNVVLAALIVLMGGVYGYQWAKSAGDNLTFGAGIGAISGFVVAAIVCGALAMLSLIENHLRLIADDVEEMRTREDRH